MSDSSPAAAEPTGSSKSPFSGCLILGIAGGMVIALVCWALWTLRYQEGEIKKFTQEEAAPVGVVVTTPDASAALAEKLTRFRTAAESGATADLTLTAGELNLAITDYEELVDLRKTFHISKIEDGQLFIDISYPLGDSPFSKRKNFLNGTMVGTVELVPAEVILRISDISVPEGTVPPEFLDHMSVHRIMEVYKEHPVLGPIMTKLTSVETVGDTIVAKIDAAAAPPSAVPEDMKPAAQRILTLMAIIATLFLTLVAGILFFAKRKSAARPL